MPAALVVAITPAERDLAVRMLKRCKDIGVDVELAEPLIELLEHAMTADQARTAFAELDPRVATDPKGPHHQRAYLSAHVMGTGKNRG